jgi:hypothetical protein
MSILFQSSAQFPDEPDFCEKRNFKIHASDYEELAALR